MMDLYGNGLLLGEKTLDSLWMRQNLTMNNIANVDTPGFKSQYMTFENELAQKIRSALTVKKTSMKNVARGIENMRPSVHTTLNESTRLDENNVDMDQEQAGVSLLAFEVYAFYIKSVARSFYSQLLLLWIPMRTKFPLCFLSAFFLMLFLIPFI